MKAVLGIDTSCYTTSAALVAMDGTILASSRKLLNVEAGKRGLMQSDGVYQHVRALPDRIDSVMRSVEAAELVAVSASVRPRPVEDSYMPVFKTGENLARAASSMLRVPFFDFSHQEGHVRAALVDTGIDRGEPMIALHLSGGTTELLLVENNRITLLGGSSDLHAGQLIDRMGVFLGMRFPAGPEMEKLALRGQSKARIGVSIKGMTCSLSGAENKARKLMEDPTITPEDMSAELFDFLARTIARMVDRAVRETGCRQVLLAGGVASSTHLRALLEKRVASLRTPCKLHFARPELSGDNAVGIALLGLESYLMTKA